MALSGWLRRLQEIYIRLGAPAGASVSADLAAVQADIGDPSAGTLGSLYAILGNPPAANALYSILALAGYDSSAVVRGVDGSILGRLEALLQKTPLLTTNLVEFWQNEAGIDGALWATTIGGVGTAARDATTNPGYLMVLLNTPSAAADTSRLASVQRWPVTPVAAAPNLAYSTATIARRLIVEFEAMVTGAANIVNGTAGAANNTGFIMGLTTAALGTRGHNDVVGFALAADAIQTLTDLGGVEDLQALAGTTITDWIKYRIEVYAGAVRFYTNETLRNTHNTANTLPTQSMYLQFFVPNDGVGAALASIKVGKVRCWIDDEAYV